MRPFIPPTTSDHIPPVYLRSVLPTRLRNLDLATGCNGLPRGAVSLFQSGDEPALYEVVAALMRQIIPSMATVALVAPPWRPLPATLTSSAQVYPGGLVLRNVADPLGAAAELIRSNLDLVALELEDPSEPLDEERRQAVQRLCRLLYYHDTVLLVLGDGGYGRRPRGSLGRELYGWARLLVDFDVRRRPGGELDRVIFTLDHRGMLPWHAQGEVEEMRRAGGNGA